MHTKLIRKYVLQNAIKFKGKASQGAVIGKILSEQPDLKEKLKELAPEIGKIIKEVSRLSVEDMTADLKKLAPELLEQKKVEKEKTTPELNNAEQGKVVLRFEPSPSGPMHVGHAYVLSLISEIARKYNGKVILRISDTNAENIYEPAYKLLPQDADWLTNNNINETYIQSDRLDIYYRYMEQLFENDNAYVCTCDPEKFRELVKNKQPCPCRGDDPDTSLTKWRKMFKGYKQGDAVVRLKTDIEHKNPAMRDFPLFRINDTAHPRTKNKYRVWPLMNMAVAIDDIEMGITHAIRAKDHYDNAIRQKYIYEYLGLVDKYPETVFLGRINFEGMPVSASKTREAIEKKQFTGWDDIRLPFLIALRKRGYQPEAFIKYAIDVGISLNDKKVSKQEFFKTLNAFNKDIIDQSSFRYFFIDHPKKITIQDAPDQDIELDLHPEKKKGGRRFKTDDKFCLAEQDLKHMKPKNLYRLMDCLNFTKKGDSFYFDSLEYEKYKEKGKSIMHWLPDSDRLIKTTVKMDDNSTIKGLSEENLKHIKKGQTVQFERFGFVTLIDTKPEHLFYFLHK